MQPHDIATFDQTFKTTQYPAGEQHIELLRGAIRARVVVANVVDFNGIMHCLVADSICAQLNIHLDWVLPYMPYARHDRRNYAGDGLELGFAVDLVRKLNATIVDPHSEVAGILPHYTQSQVVNLYREAGLFEGNPIIAIPDAGAAKKAYSWIQPEQTVVQCLKKRNPATGKLSGFQVISEDHFGERPVVIVDDICDAGGTFLGLAEALVSKDAGELRLAVTHGLFTKGTNTLFNAFDQIYTLDTTPVTDDRLTTVSITDLIRKNQPV